MPKTKRKTKLGLRHLLPALVLAFVAGSVAFYGSTQLKPGHADTAAYSCNAGDPPPNGSTCTHTTTFATTYTTSYSCRDGSTGSSTCYYNGCPSGTTSNGSTCTYSACSAYPGAVYDNWEFNYYGYCLTFDHYPASGQTSCTAGYYYVKGSNGIYGCYQKHGTQCQLGGTYDNNGNCNVSPSCGSDNVSGTTCYYNANATSIPGCGNGGTWNGSSCTSTSTYTATYHPATTSGSSGGGTSTGGGSSSSGGGSTSSGSTTTRTATSGTKSSTSPVTITPAQPPSVPSGLTAKVESSKVVDLNWTAGQAAAGIQNYEVSRSTDNSTWALLAVPSDTSYTDASTDFSTKYYYRVREIDLAGTGSDYATVSISTGKFSSSGSKITSDDKLVTVNIPSGAFDRYVSCSVTSSAGGLPSVPTKSLLIGPYDILCIDENGTIVANYKKPLQVTMDLSGASSGYGGFTAQLFDDKGSSSDAKAQYDAKAHKLNFALTASKSFAVYGTKQKSALATIFQIFLYLLLLVGVAFGALYLRRYWSGRPSSEGYPAELAAVPVATAPVAATLSPTAESVFEAAANRPACTHLSMAHQVQPQTDGCAECLAGHTHWKALRICLTCGHVGCSDDSEQQHARKHFEQTGHPLIYDYGDPAGNSIGWCYIDQTYI